MLISEDSFKSAKSSFCFILKNFVQIKTKVSLIMNLIYNKLISTFFSVSHFI